MLKKNRMLYTIGQVAKLCNISPELLRHLDKQKIFQPMARGKHNNYRYYTEEQLEDLLLIMELRRLGIPYQTITELVGNRDLYAIKQALDRNLHVMRRELTIGQRKYDQLVDLLVRISSSINITSQRTTASDEEFVIVTVPKQRVLFTRYIRDINIELNYAQYYIELMKLVDLHELTCCGPITLVYHQHFNQLFTGDNTYNPGDMEVNVCIASDSHNDVLHRTFGGFSAATFTGTGHYRGLERGYRKMTDWVKAMGHEVSGVSFQELVVGRTITNREENFVTNVYLPLNITTI